MGVSENTGVKKALVLYSGGLDSTFVAALAAPELDKVHLLTYQVPTMYGVGRTLIHLEELRRLYGPEKIEHDMVDLRPLILLIRGGFFGIVRDCVRYRFAKPVCVGCKIVMHLSTIRHCKQLQLYLIPL